MPSSPQPSTAAQRSEARKNATPSPTVSVSQSRTPRQSNASGSNTGGGGATPSPTSGLLLSAEELQQTPDNRLLSYLMNSSTAARAISIRPLLSTLASPSLAVAAAAVASTRRSVNPFTAAYVEELLTPRLLCSPIQDVPQLVACLLCDAVRLHHQQHERLRLAEKDSAESPSNTSGSTAPQLSQRSVAESQQTIEDDVAAGVAPLPFAPSRCPDVLRCIARVFADLLPSPAVPSSATPATAQPLRRAAYLIERAAVSHVLRYLLPHCPLAAEDTQQALQCIFDAVRCATSASPFVSAGSGSDGSGGAASASVATCNEMAQLITDILTATRDITSAQLTPLLEELAGASAALRRSSKLSLSSTGRAGVNVDDGSSGSLGRSGQGSGSALIAARVLLTQTEVVLQPAIAAWTAGEVEEGMEELLAADVVQNAADVDSDAENGDGGLMEDPEGDEEQQRQRVRRTQGSLSFKNEEAQLTRRRRGLRKVARVLEVLVALTELRVDLIEQVVPVLAPSLEHPSTDLRLLLVRGFGAVFAAHDAAVSTYSTTFMGPFLNRLLDVKPNIRVEALRTSAMLIAKCAVRGGHHDLDSRLGRSNASLEESTHCIAQQERLWAAFQPCWSRLLTDQHVVVRKQAVASVTEAALASPLLLHQEHRQQRGSLSKEDQPSASAVNDRASPQPPASGAHLSISHFLAQTLGLRARDKNKRVRDAAVEGLIRLYHAYRLSWIPNAVLDATRVEAANASSSTATATGAGGTSLHALTVADSVVESMLPSPSASLSPLASASAAGRQSTLTRWMGAAPPSSVELRAANVAARTPSGRPSMPLFDFERADDTVHNANDNDGPGLVKSENAEEDEGDALLGFGTATSLARSATAAQCEPLPVRAGEDSPTAAYVDGLLHLCRSLDAAHFTQLLRMAERRPQLRRAVQKLFEFHAAVKASNGDVKSAEGQQRIHAIHRLLTFLRDTTGAYKGEWDALFRAKDDTVRKAFLRACDPSHLDWVDVRDVLLRSLQGRVSANELAFVRHTLVPQMMLPTRADHVKELLRRLHRSIYVSDRAEVVVDMPEAVGVLRALLFLTAGAPSYGGLSTSGLVEALQAAAKQSVGPPPVWCALLLQALQQWATAAATTTPSSAAPAQAAAHEASAKSDALATPKQCEAFVHALRAMALASLPMQQVAVGAKVLGTPSTITTAAAVAASASASPLIALKQLAKQATRTLLALLQVRGFEKAAATALQSLVKELTRQLEDGRALTNDAKTVAWLASVQALAVHPRAAAALRPEASATAMMPPLLSHLRALLLAAVDDVSDRAELSRLPKAHSSSAAVDAASIGGEDTVSVALSSPTVSLTSTTMSVAAAIVDGAAKATTRLALSCPAAGGARATAVSYAMESLLQGYKATAALPRGRAGASSIGSCQRRLALEKQLVKLLATPTADIAKELAASVVLSVEEEVQVREVVQGKLAALLVHRSCDMRVAALLLLTAISEDTRSSYQRLRGLVESVGDHLRARQVSQGASLSSPAALYCYWEYSIPFVVLFLAHHPYFASEAAETQFVSFQRVWHLLVGELFRPGTQCAGFVVELLSKIKQSDDALDPSSDAARVMCDLGSRVLLEVLGQRQSRAEDLRRYPGAILLPSFFARTTRTSPQKLLETVFLDESVRVAPNAPFRLAATVPGAAGYSGGGAGSESRASSRPATSRASSLPAADRPLQEQDDKGTPSPAQYPQQRTPSTQRKRRRSPSVEVEPVGSSSVSLSPSIPPLDAADQASDVHPSPSSSPQRARTEPALAESSEAQPSMYPDASSSSSSNATNTTNTPIHTADELDAERREAAQKIAVDGALKKLFSGLTKPQIAQLRWKVVRARLEEALDEANTAHEEARRPPHQHQGPAALVLEKVSSVAMESNLEALLQYAKDQLRVWYNSAPA